MGLCFEYVDVIERGVLREKIGFSSFRKMENVSGSAKCPDAFMFV